MFNYIFFSANTKNNYIKIIPKENTLLFNISNFSMSFIFFKLSNNSGDIKLFSISFLIRISNYSYLFFKILTIDHLLLIINIISGVIFIIYYNYN